MGELYFTRGKKKKKTQGETGLISLKITSVADTCTFFPVSYCIIIILRGIKVMRKNCTAGRVLN